MKNLNRLAILSLNIMLMAGFVPQLTYAAPAATAVTNNDTAVNLNQIREYMERERIARQIAEDRKKEKAEVEDKRNKEEQPSKASVMFVLKQIITDESEVLDAAEIMAITDEALNKEISLDDLRAVAEKINKLYQDKGYITCRAFIGPQTIKNGIVKISLLEGKTGSVTVQGNKYTNEKYITDRLNLKEDEIANINNLNKDLLWFNGTNDSQLRISMQAGEKAGTTDYIITALEPRQYSWNIFADNAGSISSGAYRKGVFFNVSSLTGDRDGLSVGTIISQGTKAGSMQYNRSLGHSGTKLNFGYSANSVEIVSGDLQDLNIKGHASSYNVGIRQPLTVNEKMRREAGLEYTKQNSQTDFYGMHWVDDTISDTTAYVSQTNYGKNTIIYQRHGYTVGESENINNYRSDFKLYKFNGIFHKLFGHNQTLNLRLDYQWSNDDYITSGRQFYIGGMNTVRGYKESLLSGDKGVNFSAEYQIPVDEKISFFTFYDYGNVGGRSAFDDHVLASTGIGLKANIDNKYMASLSCGIPLIKEINGTTTSKTRLHFIVSGQL